MKIVNKNKQIFEWPSSSERRQATTILIIDETQNSDSLKML